jgi:polysaccharide export outer membrane protein
LSRLASGTGGSETIGVGDVLEVQIAAGLTEDDQSTMAARVANDGTISLPMIGVLNIAGVEPQGAESLIRAEAIRKQLYHNPTVTVTVTHQRMNKVRVLGAVKAPGLYELPPNASDVVSAIAAAQGLEKDAGQHVEVRNPYRATATERPAMAGMNQQPFSTASSTSANTAGSAENGMNSYSIDLISAAKAGDVQYIVQDGVVVMVEKRDPAPIYVGGLVKAAGRYDYPIGQDLHLLDAISLAGGMSNQLANKIYVVRPVVGQKDPAVIEISYRDAKRSADSNILLGPGDVVSVEQTPGTVFMEALNLIRFGISGNTTLF